MPVRMDSLPCKPGHTLIAHRWSPLFLSRPRRLVFNLFDHHRHETGCTSLQRAMLFIPSSRVFGISVTHRSPSHNNSNVPTLFKSLFYYRPVVLGFRPFHAMVALILLSISITCGTIYPPRFPLARHALYPGLSCNVL